MLPPVLWMHSYKPFEDEPVAWHAGDLLLAHARFPKLIIGRPIVSVR